MNISEDQLNWDAISTLSSIILTTVIISVTIYLGIRQAKMQKRAIVAQLFDRINSIYSYLHDVGQTMDNILSNLHSSLVAHNKTNIEESIKKVTELYEKYETLNIYINTIVPNKVKKFNKIKHMLMLCKTSLKHTESSILGSPPEDLTDVPDFETINTKQQIIEINNLLSMVHEKNCVHNNLIEAIKIRDKVLPSLLKKMRKMCTVTR